MGSIGILFWIGIFWTWLTSPSIVPWVGVVAAITAAFTVEPKTWLKSPGKFLRRALQVALVFLIVAWMLSLVARLASGCGSGEGDATGSETGKANGDAQLTPPVRVVPGQVPSGTPPHVDLVISFVPSVANESVAQEFSCDLLNKRTMKGATKVEIRAKDMQEFDKLLVQQLRSMEAPEPSRGMTVLIKRSPFPGENVLKRVATKVRTVLPRTEVVVDE